MIPDIKFGAWKGFAGSDIRSSELVITQSWSQETNYDRELAKDEEMRQKKAAGGEARSARTGHQNQLAGLVWTKLCGT